jgi:hypothetical protein
MEMQLAACLLVLWPGLWSSLSVQAAAANVLDFREASWTSMPVPSVKMRPDTSRNTHSKLSCSRRCTEQEDCDQFCYDKASKSCLLNVAVALPDDVLPPSASRCYQGVYVCV